MIGVIRGVYSKSRLRLRRLLRANILRKYERAAFLITFPRYVPLFQLLIELAQGFLQLGIDIRHFGGTS